MPTVDVCSKGQLRSFCCNRTKMRLTSLLFGIAFQVLNVLVRAPWSDSEGGGKWSADIDTYCGVCCCCSGATRWYGSTCKERCDSSSCPALLLSTHTLTSLHRKHCEYRTCVLFTRTSTERARHHRRRFRFCFAPPPPRDSRARFDGDLAAVAPDSAEAAAFFLHGPQAARYSQRCKCGLARATFETNLASTMEVTDSRRSCAAAAVAGRHTRHSGSNTI